MFDVLIIGGGPAAAAAAVYTGRKRLKTLLVTETFGGQSFVSASIENWIGMVSLSGLELAKSLEKHVRAQEDIEVRVGEKVVGLKEINGGFEATTNSKHSYQAKAVIVSTGGRRRRLGVPGEDDLDGKGVAYCSTCDAPLFRDKDVAVVGGGNAGLEGVVDLLPYANKIYLLIRGEEMNGDPITQEEVKKSDKVEIIFNADTEKIEGDKMVSGLTYKDSKSGKSSQLNVGGVFVEIGSVPNSELVKDLVKLNKFGEVIIDHHTCETSMKGLYAAGDVTDEKYKQNNISAGHGVSAALSVYNYLLNFNKQSPAAEG